LLKITKFQNMVNKKNIGDFCNVRCKAVTVWKHSFSFKFYSYGIENWYKRCLTGLHEVQAELFQGEKYQFSIPYE
jgi:hypothetical protein